MAQPESAYDAGDLRSIPRLGRSPGEGNGNPFCPENSVDRGAWRATVRGLQRVGHSLATEQQQSMFISKVPVYQGTIAFPVFL